MQKNLVPIRRAGAALSVVSSQHAYLQSVETQDGDQDTAVERYISAAKSDATKRAYANDVRQFIAAGGSIPCSPTVLVKYLAGAAESLSVATLERRLAAIHQAHVEISAPSPTKNPRVKQVMSGIRRVKGIKQRRVTALVKDDLLEALAMVDKQDNLMKIFRDRALLLVGFAGAFRRSELVGIRVEHITRLSSGIEVELPRSKTDQTGESRQVHIPFASNVRRCPVHALETWLKKSEVTEGLVFRSVDRHGNVGGSLSTHAVALIVKESVERAGGDHKAVSGHSLRAGYASTAADTLLPHQIMETTGHRSITTLTKYIRPVQRRKIPSLL